MSNKVLIESDVNEHVLKRSVNDDEKPQKLTILSFNIEGIAGNFTYLATLGKRADFILLQEHWLHSCDKISFSEFLPDFICYSKCFDDNSLLDPGQRKRGKDGVAICVRKKYSHLAEQLPDGGNRIIAVRLNIRYPIVIVCAYLPCRGSNATDSFQEILDELSEIKVKYNATASVICAGDMNASMIRDSSQDRQFQKFVNDNQFGIPNNKSNIPTFHHFNGKDVSQIDYILQSSDFLNNYITFSREALNTSTHDPIMASLSCILIPSNPISECNRVKRIWWNKVDIYDYQHGFDEKISEIIPDNIVITTENSDFLINSICNTLAEVAEKQSNATPRRRSARKSNSRRVWTPDIDAAMKQSKFYFGKWKAMGRPKESNNKHFKNMKFSKKKLRSEQRMHEAEKRRQKLVDIMSLQENDARGFYALVRKQRKSVNDKVAMIFGDNRVSDNTEILEGWSKYFTDLATPSQEETFDQNFKLQVDNDITNLTNIFEERGIHNLPNVSFELLKKTVFSLKNGKSADEFKITAEHLKFGSDKLLALLVKIVNFILSNMFIPPCLKSGIACPILKSGKPKQDPNSYRKITITTLIGKIIEKIHLQQNCNLVLKQQNSLQKGFTKGEMPIIAGLILSELVTEAKNSKSSLYIAFMDARKAFDVVWHDCLFRDMFKFGISGDNWLFFQKWYDGLTSKIRWNGCVAEPIRELQGVRQGGIWSPTAYKIFINSLLDAMQYHQLGSSIGTVYCGIPTVADDVTLVSNNADELQVMLDLQAGHANSKRYTVNQQKSTIIVINDSKTRDWSFNEKKLTVSDQATHLGIQRCVTNAKTTKETVQTRIITARRTVFALMGAGLHGLNGVNPKASIHLIKTYVVPRLLYGLEILSLSIEDIRNLENYYKKLLRQIQHIPDRTANAATFLLLGRIPIIGEVHKRMLTTYGNIIRNIDSVERDLAFRQLALRPPNSWFTKLGDLAEKYDLCSPHDILDTPPTKLAWGKLVNNAVNNYYMTSLIAEAKQKKTLALLSLENCGYGVIHNIWKSCDTDPFATTMAGLKVKIATNTLVLQANRAKFDKNCSTSPICLLCQLEPEDINHFILRCSALDPVRSPFLNKLKLTVAETRSGSLYEKELWLPENLIQLITDCTKFTFFNNIETADIETLSRGMCYRLFQKRSCLLADVA